MDHFLTPESTSFNFRILRINLYNLEIKPRVVIGLVIQVFPIISQSLGILVKVVGHNASPVDKKRLALAVQGIFALSPRRTGYIFPFCIIICLFNRFPPVCQS
ncbi:hypothetical protein GDO78_023002 [Eleutherodactylus coqui]|uniref:Uncharacterized protein n=1 Tax=Eleutherodactylus coqui TaxID=57060 RepID=A0A8J6B2D2_ELECQ|nr:hypothetical protein GDO78_023002 [Eleutherodactylus coqui]